ncbi:MAG: hypothetical protein GY852_08450 [bacterium]|nr:hypothetical protein [bacterium]
MKVCKKMELRDGMLITGGHFLIKEDGTPELNKGTIESFRKAAELYKEGKREGYRVGLGILINDIGAVCGNSGGCKINEGFSRESFSFPEEYLKILMDLGIPKGEVDIYWEKHMRNRGKKLLVKVIDKTRSVDIFDGIRWLIGGDGTGIALSKERKHDKYGNAACPLIMAAYHMEQERRGYDASINFYYVGEDNKRNISYHPVIEQGKALAEELEANILVENIYFATG